MTRSESRVEGGGEGTVGEGGGRKDGEGKKEDERDVFGGERGVGGRTSGEQTAVAAFPLLLSQPDGESPGRLVCTESGGTGAGVNYQAPDRMERV